MAVAVNQSPGLTRKYQPTYKWLLAIAVVVVLALGWHFPALGFVVPLTMAAGMGSGVFRGRWVCGNLCPRGSLLDTWLGALPRRPLPAWRARPTIRWGILALLIGLMAAQLALDPGNWRHWGIVFWRMCLITTTAALALAFTSSSRGWCSICPVGTVAAKTGGDKHPLRIAASCRACGLCEQACPMQFAIAKHRRAGQLPHRDCLKCSTCLKVCSHQALSWSAKRWGT